MVVSEMKLYVKMMVLVLICFKIEGPSLPAMVAKDGTFENRGH